jgi:3-deoxy-7-phosphoheptulonate synthase
MNLPSPRELKESLPLHHTQRNFIAACQKIASDLSLRKDERTAIIVGPCSIHNTSAAFEYARRFKELATKVENNIFLVMRVYVEKPRTTVGWKGLLYDPHLDGTYDIRKGLYETRKLLLALAEMQVPTATEFVDPLSASYIDDLITWGFIGARTCESQPHRELASSLSMPVGFKNGTDGMLEGAINALIAAEHPHSFLSINIDGKIAARTSRGNPLSHLVLRGSSVAPNYDTYSVKRAVDLLIQHQLLPRILVDCAHGNCQKQPDRQKDVFASVIERIASGDPHLMGVMLESHLEAGRQLHLNSSPKGTVSITDPCIDWDSTEELISWAGSSLSLIGTSSSSFSGM